MLIDARSLQDGSEICADLIVIGSGAAGLSIAREFSGSAVSVCILESGGEDSSFDANRLSAGSGRIVGPEGETIACDEYVADSRERSFGGTLNLWGGKCAELDAIDFEARDWIKHSGWPLDKREMQPYYDRASALLGITGFSASQRQATTKVSLNGDRDFVTALRTFSALTGKLSGEQFHRFKHAVAAAPNITVHVHANVVDVVADEEVGRIKHLAIACLDGKRHVARGKVYVLAAGGLENARILLNADSQQSGGLGNQHDLVGRFFGGHGMFRSIGGPGEPPAMLEFAPQAHERMGLYLDKDNTKVQGVFALSRAMQRRECLPGFSATLEPVIHKGGREYSPVFFTIEQRPNAESRLSLSHQRDALGLRRLVMDWRFLKADQEALEQSVAHFSRELERAEIGRLLYDPKRIAFVEILEAARHHIGATRMHDDPCHGVVDRNCRVHGLENLYLAGASVFPTPGIANPTLTIVALALRLADRLKAQLYGNSATATQLSWAEAPA